MAIVEGKSSRYGYKIIVALSLLFIVGCSGQINKGSFRVDHSATDFLALHKLQSPSVEHFQVCAAQGCDRISTLSYDSKEWQQIAGLFDLPVTSADQERQQVAQAVALVERLVGGKNGTLHDAGRNSGLFSGYPQLDCVAESANTTVAMLLLQQRGMLQYHRVVYPQNRNILSFRAHYSAALEELESKRRFAVDSWFFANGELPVVVPLDDWKDGFDPES